MEGFRRTWRAIALAVVFALVGASFALAMPAAINFVTRTVTSEPTLYPLPPGTDPSPLYTPGAPELLLDEPYGADQTEVEDRGSISRRPVVIPRAEGRPDPGGRSADNPKKPKKTKKAKKAKKPSPDKPDKPGPPEPAEPPVSEPPEKPDAPAEPEPAEPGSPDDDETDSSPGSGNGNSGQAGNGNGNGNGNGGKGGGKGKGSVVRPFQADGSNEAAAPEAPTPSTTPAPPEPHS